MKTRYATTGADDLANLKAHLARFYSPGQLSLYYYTLIDGKPIPDCRNPKLQTLDAERQMRAEAIRQILNITPAAPVEQPVAGKSKRK